MNGRRVTPRFSNAKESQAPRVAFFSPCLGSGGTERWLLDVARFSGFDTVGLCVSPRAEVYPSAIRELRRYMPVHGSDTRGPATDLLTRHRTWPEAFAATVEDADALIIWGMTTEVDLLDRSNLPPVVVSVSHGEGDWTRQWLAQCRPICTHFAAVAEAARQVYSDDQRANVRVIHNGADPARCVPRLDQAELRRRHRIPLESKVIGYIGRYAPDKDPAATIRAVAALPKNYFAVFQGSGDLEPALRKMCQALIPGRFAFLPYSSEVGTALSMFDAIIIGSEHEGFCYVIVEAWLARCPVISTRVGVIPEAETQFGQLSWPIPFKDPGPVLASRVQSATAENAGTREIRDRAFQTAWQHYTAPQMGQEWFNYITTLIGGNCVDNLQTAAAS